MQSSHEIKSPYERKDSLPESYRKIILDRKALTFMWQYARSHFQTLIGAAALGVVIAALGTVPPWAMKKLTEGFSTSEELRIILLWVGIGLAGVACRSSLEVWNRMIMVTLLGRVTNQMRKDAYLKIQESALEYHINRRVGEVASILGNEISNAASGVIELFSSLWFRPMKVIFIFAVMFYFNPLLSILGVIILPVVASSISKISRRARQAEFRFFEHQSKMVGDMVESLTNVRQVKSFGLEAYQTKKVEAAGEKLIIFRNQAVFSRSLVSPVTEITGGTVIAIMAALAYFQHNNGLTTAGDITGCLVAALSLKAPIKELSGCLVLLQRSFAAIHRIKWISGETAEPGDLQPVKFPVQTIEFKNVSFSYDGRRSILANLNLRLHKGERLALIGDSGAGKTTLLDLLSGFYPCTSGRILVDGKDLTSIDIRTWRRQIGIVSQEPFLFNGTIEDNIRAGDLGAGEEKIFESCLRAGCGSMLKSLPDGLKTRVGERGCRLSGGERKRVALARALVRPISILLLDEATSELDPVAEESVLDVIDRLAKELIVVHSSHRQSILKHCDRAVLLEAWSIKPLNE